MSVDSPLDPIAPTELAVPAAPAVTPPRSTVLLNHAALILSFVGVFVAAVLSVAHVLARSIPCGDDGGCDIVASNPASQLVGIPVAYLGLAAYLLIATISVVRGLKGLGRTKALGSIALAVSGVGALFSFYLQYISFTQIHALCIWCLVSAVAMSLLFLVQAAIAQTEIPSEAGKVGDGGIVLAVGLALIALLGTGYEAMTIMRGSDSNMLAIGMGSQEIVELLITPDSMKVGPDTAPIKIIDFSDLLCPSCRAIYPDMKQLVKDSNGKVQLLFRHRPLTKNTSHQMATPAAFYAEYAAEKGDGWKFVDEIYQHDVSEIQTMDQLNAVAKKVGIDIEDAQARMVPEDPLWKKVMRDLGAAEKIGITETPTFVIFAPGQQPQAASGREVLRTVNRPEYQAIINGR